MRLQPSVKLKIDMLNTSMGSCLCARGREALRSVLLKLFSRDLAFIVISYSNASVPCVQSPRCSGGILKCLFRGRKEEWQCDALVAILLHHGELDQSPRDILMNSAWNAFGEGASNSRISSESVTAHQVFEQVIFDHLNV